MDTRTAPPPVQPLDAADGTVAEIRLLVRRSSHDPASDRLVERRASALRRRAAAAPTARRVARLGPEARALRTEVAAWALAHSATLDYDALTVILAVKQTLPEELRTWREEDVWRLWWLDLSRWCATHAVAVPPAMGASLVALFACLDTTDGFGPGSDDLDDLDDALGSAGAHTAAASRRHPAS